MRERGYYKFTTPLPPPGTVLDLLHARNCLGFAPRSQNLTFGAELLFVRFARYPDLRPSAKPLPPKISNRSGFSPTKAFENSCRAESTQCFYYSAPLPRPPPNGARGCAPPPTLALPAGEGMHVVVRLAHSSHP